jgi:arabinofuranosyltransferase
VGGDFMHGRFLLPATFAVLMPVAAVATGEATSERRRAAAALAVVVPWALVVVAGARPGYDAVGPDGVADERGFYTAFAGTRNPTTVEDYARPDAPFDFYLAAAEARVRAERGERVLIAEDDDLPSADRYGLVARRSNIGIYGVVAGRRVFVADTLSLANPVGARLDLPAGASRRVGHAQLVPLVWDQARYAAPAPDDGEDVRDARAALSCGDLARLDAAITGAMTPRRFLHNLTLAPALTRLSVPADPAEARAGLCGRR